MRRVTFIALWLVGACSAVDNFNNFTFPGGPSGHPDMRGSANLPDMARPNFGEACNPGDCANSLTCYTNLGTDPAPGGICSHACNSGLGSCSDVPNGVCIEVSTTGGGTSVCLERCSLGQSCRTGFKCCMASVPGPGAGEFACAPDGASFCH
jgi:hypothetical protein